MKEYQLTDIVHVDRDRSIKENTILLIRSVEYMVSKRTEKIEIFIGDPTFQAIRTLRTELMGLISMINSTLINLVDRKEMNKPVSISMIVRRCISSNPGLSVDDQAQQLL
jgi:hypothetical protein